MHFYLSQIYVGRFVLRRKKIRRISQLGQVERSFLFVLQKDHFDLLVVDLKAAVQYRQCSLCSGLAGWLAGCTVREHPVGFLEPGSTRETGAGLSREP